MARKRTAPKDRTEPHDRSSPKSRAAGRAPRPKGLIWSGSISFGLVNIPVSLHSAENSKELGFSMLDRRDMAPIGYKKINKNTGEEVPSKEIVKGYKYGEDRYVTVTEADLKRASPEKTQRVDIIAFVDGREIKPVYFDRPYYLEPRPKSEKAYGLLRDAMKRAGQVGIANVVLRARQYLAAVIPSGPALVLELLRYPAELRDPTDLHLPAEDAKKLGVSEAELGMALRLIEELKRPWDPSQYRDEYRDELLAFIEEKARKGEVKEGPPVEKEASLEPPADIMALLKKSLGSGAKGKGAASGRFLH